VVAWLVLSGSPFVDGEELESVGPVGVADEDPVALGDELGVVVGADDGEVGDLVAAGPGSGDEVVDVEVSGTDTTRPTGMPVA